MYTFAFDGMGFKMAKLRVGIVFGGKSAEHEVSCNQQKNIVDAIDETRFDVVLLGIDKAGQWHVNDAERIICRMQTIGTYRATSFGNQSGRCTANTNTN